MAARPPGKEVSNVHRNPLRGGGENAHPLLFRSGKTAVGNDLQPVRGRLSDGAGDGGAGARLSDGVTLEEGTELTDELLMQALPLESFVSVSADEALPNVLGLLLRTAVADGRISDEELLSVQPALEGRNWRANVAVQVGDVFTYKGSLWRCIQAHTTQGGWQPDKAPALWHKVEIVAEGTVRVWEKGVAYAVGDVVAFPKEDGTQYTCIQVHTSQAGGSRRPRPRCGRHRGRRAFANRSGNMRRPMRAAFVLFPSQGGNIMRDFSIDLVWAKLQMAIAAVGGWLGYFVGGVDGLMTALLVLMVMDYVTGSCAR